MLTSGLSIDGTPVSSLSRGSEKRVELKCDECGTVSCTTWSNYNQYQSKAGWTGITHCQPCAARINSRNARGRKAEHTAIRNRATRGASHPSWKGGRYIDAHGYVMVSVQSGHKGESGWKSYKKEHVVVAESMLGRPLLKTEVVHHIDGDKTNNKQDNLWPTDHSHHRIAHASLSGIGFLLVRAGLVTLDVDRGVYVADVKLRELLEHPESRVGHSEVGNDSREAQKTDADWAISSQASERSEEGSTTRPWSLTRDSKGPRVRSAKAKI